MDKIFLIKIFECIIGVAMTYCFFDIMISLRNLIKKGDK